MVINQVINGRPAYVMPLDENWDPATTIEQAALLKVMFLDNQEVVFVNRDPARDMETALQMLKQTLRKAGFNPSEQRDPHGRWSGGGGTGRLSVGRLRQHVDKLYAQYKPHVRTALAATTASIITQFDNADMNTEAVTQSLIHLSHLMEIPVLKARDHIKEILRRAKHRPEAPDEFTKAQPDLTDAEIDELIAWLDKLKLPEK